MSSPRDQSPNRMSQNENLECMSHDQQARGNITTIGSVAKTAITTFLESIKYSMPHSPPDLELAARVRVVTTSWGLAERLRPHIVTALNLTETGYYHLVSMDAKVAVTLYTSLLTAIDTNYDDLSTLDYGRRWCRGTAVHDTGLLGHLARNLMEMWDYYPPFSAGAIFGATSQFLNVCMLENVTGDVDLHPQALPFIEYRRSMSGVPEAYACFIWEKSRFPNVKDYVQAIPDICLYIDYVNDVMSFYKEEMAGETATYIHDRALVTRKTPLATLDEVIAEIVAAVDRIRTILGEGEAREAWESFAKGYIRFHDGPRYRLREILGDKHMMDISHY